VTTPPDPSIALVPVSETASALALPDIVRRAGQAAVLAAEEFFYGADSAERSLNVAIRCHGPVLAVTAFKFAQALKHSRPTRPVGRPPFAGGSDGTWRGCCGSGHHPVLGTGLRRNWWEAHPVFGYNGAPEPLGSFRFAQSHRSSQIKG
jgi:hypothetical protein